MKNRFSKSERLAKIIAELCEGKQTVLAERLGKSQQNMNLLIKKGTWFDACALAEAFPELNAEWLLNGEGEMLKDIVSNTPGDDSDADAYEVNGQNKEAIKEAVRETLTEMLARP